MRDSIGVAAGAGAALAGATAGAFVCLATGGGRLLPWAIAPAAGAAAAMGAWRLLARRAGKGRRLAALLPFLALLIPALFFPDYCIGVGPPAAVSAAIGGIAALAFAATAFLTVSPDAPAWEERMNRRARTIVVVAVILFAGITFARAVAVYRVFGFAGHDLCVFAQSFWTSLHGRLFWNTEECYPGCSRFGKQLCPIMFLLVPFFKCAPHCATIFALDALALALGAGMLYRIARSALGEYAAACFALAYLLHPGISYQALFPFYFIHYAPLFLLLALYFFARERLGAFMAALLLCWSLREDIALTTFVFGVYALLLRRRVAWVVIPALGSALWFAAAVWLVIPALGPGTARYFFEGADDGVVGIARWFAADPGAALMRLLSPRMLKLAYLVLMPFGVVLPLLSAEILFAAPTFLLLGLSSSAWMKSIAAYYYLPAVPFLFAGAIAVVARCSRSSRLPFATGRRVGNAIATLLLFLSCATFIRGPLIMAAQIGIRPFRCQPDAAHIEALREALRLIPRDASVYAPRYLAPHLAMRPVVMFKIPRNADYLIIDGRAGDPATRDIQKGAPIRSPAYHAVFEKEGVAVYRREGR
ncbi:MAG: DUF2079 domain-containing protein [Candidatus Aureabacteria bacterium]|nr:DUF2079 domain-containing protein [Candidatus Auribacterota bacterium]NLW94115.1 DUF2079 domain-containing protein [Chlamydiota bacterium]HOE27049.1 DUF2079 domain-containing protein [bacterium]HQM51986.1 DUF2079 domain-containing protein [bacterium]